ncbi:hypothetical protein O6H91_17G028100 [Diphasiastrum complanatum]|uniref:Uncharacterized protein n=1 Tax=Diphasiastrum complanatum TaxID=34168 RepID=A0ACC2B666_DIPCM|nr:hypothetical protein O6H91_17G028100 [Diphasiastrum complanatum]
MFPPLLPWLPNPTFLAKGVNLVLLYNGRRPCVIKVVPRDQLEKNDTNEPEPTIPPNLIHLFNEGQPTVTNQLTWDQMEPTLPAVSTSKVNPSADAELKELNLCDQAKAHLFNEGHPAVTNQLTRGQMEPTLPIASTSEVNLSADAKLKELNLGDQTKNLES